MGVATSCVQASVLSTSPSALAHKASTMMHVGRLLPQPMVAYPTAARGMASAGAGMSTVPPPPLTQSHMRLNSSIAASVALSAAAAATSSRRHRIRVFAFGPAPPPAAGNQDVVDVVPAGESVIADVLQHVEQHGVPVRSQVMEYSRTPRSSPLAQCGFEPLEAAAAVHNCANLLISELQACGVQDRGQAEVAAAVVCLMLRGVDEAHNLVTPHSRASPTTFGGPPKYGSAVKLEASYCNVIVHRMEGNALGEFGNGFKNSGYWISTAFPSEDHPIFPAIRAAAGDLAENCRDAQVALRTMGPNWKPKDFNKLCEEAMLLEEPDLLEFCSRVQARELRLLFDYLTEGATF